MLYADSGMARWFKSCVENGGGDARQQYIFTSGAVPVMVRGLHFGRSLFKEYTAGREFALLDHALVLLYL